MLKNTFENSLYLGPIQYVNGLPALICFYVFMSTDIVDVFENVAMVQVTLNDDSYY